MICCNIPETVTMPAHNKFEGSWNPTMYRPLRCFNFFSALNIPSNHSRIVQPSEITKCEEMMPVLTNTRRQSNECLHQSNLLGFQYIVTNWKPNHTIKSRHYIYMSPSVCKSGHSFTRQYYMEAKSSHAFPAAFPFAPCSLTTMNTSTVRLRVRTHPPLRIAHREATNPHRSEPEPLRMIFRYCVASVADFEWQ